MSNPSDKATRMVNYCVSEMTSGICLGYFMAASKASAMANARLIAAAPDLLDALVETRMGEDRADGLPCWCQSPTLAKARGGHGRICSMARAAIAKAGGK